MLKKRYIKPLTEAVHSQFERAFMANTVEQDDWADAKRNTVIYFDVDEGNNYNDDPWDTDPWGINYDLWSEGD